ncbi:MATE family efflux transporter [Adhaeribacter arboris]|uniref:Multidrug-efflux transporter n=1 Tax=Adhaeribacter arboris TaxID=2072846 RepID=A0A2T2YBM7_9BACT|nr:MATE family efflux transporter [Adhaeribacter arboris]PSR52917.1 MATE family efflux transporter [Adhaeribacter arboris]
MLASDFQSHLKQNFHLAYPVVLSQLGHILVTVCDSIMVGRTGTLPLAAASLGNSVFTLFMVWGLGISMGITPLIASADGRKNRRRISLLLFNGTLVCSILGVILFILGYSFAPYLYFLHQPPEVVRLAIPYLQILFCSLIPLMIFQGLRQFAEGLSLTRQSMYISVLANIVNFGLNYLLVFGNLGFPRLGLQGAATATLIARLMMPVMMGMYIWRAPRFAEYRYKIQRKLISFKHMRRIIQLGFPIALQMIFEMSAFSFSAIMIGWLGAKQLAAHQIAINVAAVTYMMASGIAAAATIRVSNELGRGRYQQMRQAGYSSILMAFMFMSVMAILLILGKSLIPLLYVSDIQVIQMAGGLLIIGALFQLSDGVQVVGLGALRGLEDVKVPGFISLLAYWIIGLPTGYFLCFHAGLGVNGIWLGLLTGLTIAACLLFLRFKKLSASFARRT